MTVVFTGQGSQRPGMGKDFFDNYAQAKQIFEQASEAIQIDMAALCFEEDPRLDLTEFTQPAILTAEIAMFQVLQDEFRFQPHFFAGHSLGEYTALVAAGVMSLKHAVQIVHKRGSLMQQAVPTDKGAMAAIIKENILQSETEQVIRKHQAEIANYNSTEQIVMSGEKSAVESASQAIEQEIENVRVVPLNVSAPFHSSLMQPIEKEFSAYLQQFASHLQPANSQKVISNFSGAFHQPNLLIENLVKQISGSVRWLQNMELLKTHSSKIIEVGPNRVLTKFFSTIGAEVPAVINLRSAKKVFS